MTEPTRFDAVVTRAGWVRTRDRELRCDGAASLAAGVRVQVTTESTSTGESAVLAGGASAPSYDNTALRGNPWTGGGR